MSWRIRALCVAVLLASCTTPDEPSPDTGADLALLPDQPFATPDEADFGRNPTVGLVTSHRFIYAALDPGATRAQLDDLLEMAQCSLGGTLPQAGFFQMDCGPDPRFERVNETVELLRDSPALVAVTLDSLLGVTSVPPPPVTIGAGDDPLWAWDFPPQGHNWGLERIGAPQAWSLNHHIRKRLAPARVSPWPRGCSTSAIRI